MVEAVGSWGLSQLSQHAELRRREGWWAAGAALALGTGHLTGKGTGSV